MASETFTMDYSLQADLNKGSRIFLLCSDDPLLKLENSRSLLQEGRKLLPDADLLLYTFSDFQSTGGPNLKALENEMADPGLFGGDRIIKIILKDLDATAVELFKLIAGNFRPGLFIVIELPRINAAFRKVPALDPAPLRRTLSFSDEAADTKSKSKSKGRKKSSSGDSAKKEALGYLLSLKASINIFYPPEGQEILRWIEQRATRYQLTAAPDTLDFIARSCDNNLLAIDQSLQLMNMLKTPTAGTRQTLSLEDVETYFAQDARYTGFELPQAIMKGDQIRALNIIASFCSGESGNRTAAISMLISRMEECLITLALGREQNIARAPKNSQYAFFMSRNVRIPTLQDCYLQTMRNMPDEHYWFLTRTLSEAARAASCFDTEGAYRALQRMAAVRSLPAITGLSSDLLV